MGVVRGQGKCLRVFACAGGCGIHFICNLDEVMLVSSWQSRLHGRWFLARRGEVHYMSRGCSPPPSNAAEHGNVSHLLTRSLECETFQLTCRSYSRAADSKGSY
jgi:hypothetical protein